MSDNSFTEIDTPKMTYDPVKDGVWISDGTETVAFLPRGVVIKAVGVLAAEGQDDE